MWPFNRQKKVVEADYDDAGGYFPPEPDMIVRSGPVTFAPLPLEQSRNDIYAQGYTYPKAQSDRDKNYNNAYWGNRLPDSGVGIGIPGHGGVSQKMWWTQYSPEQSFIKQYSLQGGAFPYGMSMQQAADIMQQQQTAWKVSAGYA
jgi:hypothetical protein